MSQFVFNDLSPLQESLDEVTVKDMLEGDNMYTCSHCQKKVRAEKRCVKSHAQSKSCYVERCFKSHEI